MTEIPVYKEFVVNESNYYTPLCQEPLPEGSQMFIYPKGTDEGVWSDVDISGYKIAGSRINEWRLALVETVKYRIPIQ